MTISFSVWGKKGWGSSKWGRARYGAIVSGSLVSIALVNAIFQGVPAQVRLSATVKAGGVDLTEYVSRIDIKNYALGTPKTAEITLAKDRADEIIVRHTEITVDAAMICGDKSFSSRRFTGVVTNKKSQTSQLPRQVTLTCMDKSYVLDQKPSWSSAPYTGSALSIISLILSRYGIAAYKGTFRNYSITGLDLTQFSTARDLINALVPGRRPGYSFLDSNGVYKIMDAGIPEDSGWMIPKTGQVENTDLESASQILNQVTAQNNEGAVGKYRDIAHQAIYGVLETTLNAPYCTTISALVMFGRAIAELSQAGKKKIVMPYNPFMSPSIQLGIEDANGDCQVIIVEKITETMDWESGWKVEIKGQKLPILPVLPDDFPTIFDNSNIPGFYWQGPLGHILIQNAVFTITSPKKIRFIRVHQFNFGNGKIPGTVKLKNAGTLVEYGPYPMTGNYFRAVENAVWEVLLTPGEIIPAGTYEVISSDPASISGKGSIWNFPPMAMPGYWAKGVQSVLIAGEAA